LTPIGIISHYQNFSLKEIPFPAFICQIDEEGQFILVDYNQAFYQMTNKKIEKFFGKNIQWYIKRNKELMNGIVKCLENKNDQKETFLYNSPVTHRKMEVIGYFSYHPPDMISIILVDISEQIEIRRTLEEERKAYQLIAEASLLSKNTKELGNQVLKGLLKLFGFDFGNVYKYNKQQRKLEVVAFVAPEEYKNSKTRTHSINSKDSISAYVALKKKIIYSFNVQEDDWLLEHFSDRIELYDLKAMICCPILNNARELIGILNLGSWKVKNEPEHRKIIFFQSISEMIALSFDKALTSEALQSSEQRYRNLINTTPDAIMVLDHNFRVTMVNEQAVTLFAYDSLDQLIGLNWFDLILSEYDSNYNVNLNQILEQTIRNLQYEFARADGTSFIGEVNISAFQNEDKQLHDNVIIIRDITERIKLEAELIKSQKIESLGILAGGIAHDFNNLLTAIQGNIDLAKKNCPKNMEATKRLDLASIAIKHSKSLARQLLTFSKGGAPLKEELSVSPILKEIAQISLSGSNVFHRFVLDPKLWKVKVDRGQFSQIINNLLTNAKEAMPEGGVITIKAENVTFAEQEHHRAIYDKYIRIQIIDQGIGISKEDQIKVFDPFYTTKEKGKGLGLAIAYSIISKHDGFIELESEKDKGTCFSIYIPALIQDTKKKPFTKQKQMDAIKQKITARIEANTQKTPCDPNRLLILDDDENILKVLKAIFKEKNYEVSFVKDGLKAVELYKKAMEQGNKYDLLIFDLTIKGGVSGEIAFKKIRELDKNAKAIVSSGYSDNPVLGNYREYGFSGVLPKPYTIKELEKTIIETIQNK
jgi:PAS domain S-box-containing protein